MAKKEQYVSYKTFGAGLTCYLRAFTNYSSITTLENNVTKGNIAFYKQSPFIAMFSKGIYVVCKKGIYIKLISMWNKYFLYIVTKGKMARYDQSLILVHCTRFQKSYPANWLSDKFVVC